jgi:hypothetical protein
VRKTFTGTCHCGAVRFETDVDLSAGTIKCNCDMCTKSRMWSVVVPPENFRLVSGDDHLNDYNPDGSHHLFCKHCGVRPYAWGDDPALGGKFYAVRVSALDEIDVDELVNAPVRYFDGRNDRYDRSPLETRHL